MTPKAASSTRAFQRTRQSLSLLVVAAVLGLLWQSVFAAPLLRSDRIVTIKPGETLSQVVERELGSSAYWPAIAEHNGILDPADLKAGQKLRIPVPYTRSKENAVVLFVKGQVTHKAALSRATVELRKGQLVQVGDELRTGQNGFASVEFASGSVINVQPDSHVLIVDIECAEQAETCVIELFSEKGDVQSRVESRAGQATQFRINTPSGSAAVRGTRFDLSANAERAATGVTEGVVDMLAAGQTAPVESGFGVVAENGEPPGDPVALLSPPLIRQPGPRLSSSDYLRWWPDDLAVAYEVSLSYDEEGVRTVSVAEVAEPAYAPSGVPAGEYVATVRAIDSNGLKGLPAKTAVVLVDEQAASATPTLQAGVEDELGVFTLTGTVAGAQRYELQVGTDAEFSEVFPVDVQAGEGAQYTIPSGGALWARVRAVFPDRQVSSYSQTYRVTR